MLQSFPNCRPFFFILLLIGIPAMLCAENNPARLVKQIVAHRGSSADRPENTLVSTRRAIEVRATAVVVDVRTSEIIVTGLSMPHSPRVYRDQLWLLDSGTGHFGRVDRNTGKFELLTFCPGYMRGMSFIGDYAVIGLSQCRENRTFQDLALDENLKKHDAEAHCGLCVIDMRTGDLVAWLWLQGVVRELYDVVVLPGVRRPSVLGFKTDEIRRTITIGK